MPYDEPPTTRRTWIFTIVAIIVIAIAMTVLGLYVDSVSDTVTYTNIYSLGDGSQIHGSFVLGSGEFDQRSVYYYFAPSVYGGYIKCNIPSDNTAVFMDQPSNPYLKTYYWFNVVQRYELHVPPGTIVKQYSVGVDT
jgi:hypothetical protein